jgi:hypothetical protein
MASNQRAVLLFAELMANSEKLVPAQQLAAANRANYPNESAEYRAARNELLAALPAPRRQTN